MSAATHRAMFVLDIYAVDDTAAREIVDNAAAAAIVDPGIVALEAGPPARRRHEPGSLPTNAHEQGYWLDNASAELAGSIILGYLELAESLHKLGFSPATPHRETLEALAQRLGGQMDLEPLEPVAGEVYPLHRGSRA